MLVPVDSFATVPPIWSEETYGERYFWFDTFISHASVDHYDDILSALTSRGVRAWHDGGEVMQDARWPERIVLGLRNSRSVTVVLQGTPLDDRHWVLAEVRNALEAERESGVRRVEIVRRDRRIVVPDWLVPAHLTELDGGQQSLDELASRLIGANRFHPEFPSVDREAVPDWLRGELGLRVDVLPGLVDLFAVSPPTKLSASATGITEGQVIHLERREAEAR
jgi:hypothetical protein